MIRLTINAKYIMLMVPKRTALASPISNKKYRLKVHNDHCSYMFPNPTLVNCENRLTISNLVMQAMFRKQQVCYSCQCSVYYWWRLDWYLLVFGCTPKKACCFLSSIGIHDLHNSFVGKHRADTWHNQWRSYIGCCMTAPQAMILQHCLHNILVQVYNQHSHNIMLYFYQFRLNIICVPQIYL